MCEVKPMEVIKSALVGGMVGGGAGAVEAGALDTAGQLIGGLAPPPPPALTPTPPAPIPPQADTEAIARSRKLTLARMLAMGGRSSTILSQPTNNGTLGG